MDRHSGGLSSKGLGILHRHWQINNNITFLIADHFIQHSKLMLPDSKVALGFLSGKAKQQPYTNTQQPTQSNLRVLN